MAKGIIFELITWIKTRESTVGFIVLILGGCPLDSDGPVNMFHAPLAPTKRALHQKILEEKLLIRAIYYNSTCVLNIDFGILSKHLRFSNLDFCQLLENPPIVSGFLIVRYYVGCQIPKLYPFYIFGQKFWQILVAILENFRHQHSEINWNNT